MGNGASVGASHTHPINTHSPPTYYEMEDNADKDNGVKYKAPLLEPGVSLLSKNALHSMSAVEEEYTKLKDNFTQKCGIDRNDLETMLKAKHAIAQLMGDIDKLQFNKVG